jgi:hypothetical protein
MRSGCAAATGLPYPQSFPYISCETQVSVLTDNMYIYSPVGYLGTYLEIKSGTYDKTVASLAYSTAFWWATTDLSCFCWAANGGTGAVSYSADFGPANYASCSDTSVRLMCAYPFYTTQPTNRPTTHSPSGTPSRTPSRNPTMFPSRAPRIGTYAPFAYPPQLTVYLYPLYTTAPSDALCLRALPRLPDTVQGIQAYLFRAGLAGFENALYRTFTNATYVSLDELMYRDFRPTLGEGCFYFGDECNSCGNWTIADMSARAPAGCIRLAQYNIGCDMPYYHICAAVLDYDPLTASPTRDP